MLGESTWSSEAWKDPRFDAIAHEFYEARTHQCMTGLKHPDGSGPATQEGHQVCLLAQRGLATGCSV